MRRARRCQRHHWQRRGKQHLWAAWSRQIHRRSPRPISLSIRAPPIHECPPDFFQRLQHGVLDIIDLSAIDAVTATFGVNDTLHIHDAGAAFTAAGQGALVQSAGQAKPSSCEYRQHSQYIEMVMRFNGLLTFDALDFACRDEAWPCRPNPAVRDRRIAEFPTAQCSEMNTARRPQQMVPTGERWRISNVVIRKQHDVRSATLARRSGTTDLGHFAFSAKEEMGKVMQACIRPCNCFQGQKILEEGNDLGN